jgi:hypothetical protein
VHSSIGAETVKPKTSKKTAATPPIRKDLSKLMPVANSEDLAAVLNGHWAKQKKEELKNLYDAVADACAKYPSIVAVTALELVKTQILLDKLKGDSS